SRWDSLVGVRLSVGLAPLVAQIVCQRAVQVNDFVALPCADAALRTKKNDLHVFSSYLCCSRFQVQSSRLGAGTLNMKRSQSLAILCRSCFVASTSISKQRPCG